MGKYEAGLSLANLDITAQKLAMGTGLHRRYFDLRESMRARLETIDLEKNRELGVLFVHVPKCGGSSIEDQIGIFHGHRSATYFRTADKDMFNRCCKMSVVRNPYDRMVSAFHYLKNHTKSERDQEWARANLSAETFPEFLEQLQDRSCQARIMSWIHFQPQWYYLCDASGTLLMDLVGRIEKFDDMLTQVAEKTGIEVQNVRIRPSRREAWASYYTPANAKIIQDLYARDFEIFAYDTAIS